MSEADPKGPGGPATPEPDRPAPRPRVRRAVTAETWMLTESVTIPRPRRPRP